MLRQAFASRRHVKDFRDPAAMRYALRAPASVRALQERTPMPDESQESRTRHRAASTRRHAVARALPLLLASLLATSCADSSSSGNPVTGEAPLTCPEVVDTTRCDPSERFRIRVKFDFAVNDGGNVEVVTQSGPYQFPASYLDQKPYVYLFTAKGEIFQGDLREALSIGGGTMQGPVAEFATDAIFPAGEYEFLTFIDAQPGPEGFAGPARGDLAAFDNTVCDPTGISIRVAVDCKDGEITIPNSNWIIF